MSKLIPRPKWTQEAGAEPSKDQTLKELPHGLRVHRITTITNYTTIANIINSNSLNTLRQASLKVQASVQTAVTHSQQLLTWLRTSWMPRIIKSSFRFFRNNTSNWRLPWLSADKVELSVVEAHMEQVHHRRDQGVQVRCTWRTSCREQRQTFWREADPTLVGPMEDLRVLDRTVINHKRSMRIWRKSCLLNIRRCRRREAEQFRRTNSSNSNKLSNRHTNHQMPKSNPFWIKRVSNKLNRHFRAQQRHLVRANNKLMMQTTRRILQRLMQIII